MKPSRFFAVFLLLVLLFSQIGCSSPDETPKTPLPPSATPDEIQALKSDTPQNLTLLYPLINDARYTADSIWIDSAKEELLDYESAMIERFERLASTLNVTFTPHPVEDTESGFWEIAKTLLDSEDPTVDMIVRPQSLILPDEMKRHFAKTSDITTDSGSVILGDVTKADAYSVLGNFSLTAKTEPIALYLNESLLPDNSELLESIPALIQNGKFTFEEFLKIAKAPLSEGVSPLVAEKNTLAAYLTVAFSAKTADDPTVQNALATLENENLVSDTGDPIEAFLQNRALFLFAPIGSLGIDRPLRAAWDKTVALPLPKATATASYNACYSERLDLYSISAYSDHKRLAAAALAYLDQTRDETLSGAFWRDLYACRCDCIRNEIWEETVKVYENDCIFRLYALDKGKKG